VQADTAQRRARDRPADPPPRGIHRRVGEEDERMTDARQLIGNPRTHLGRRLIDRAFVPLGRADQPFVKRGHTGEVVQDPFVDAQARLGNPGRGVEIDEPPVPQRAERRDGVPMRLRKQRQGERETESHGVAGRDALRVGDGGAESGVDLDPR
jgi:hypothetical protein